MKQLLILLTALMLVLPQLCYAEDEVIWETDQIKSLNGILVAPQGEIFYNISAQTIQIRRIEDGIKIDSIMFDDVPNQIYHLSVSADGRYMALTGDKTPM